MNNTVTQRLNMRINFLNDYNRKVFESLRELKEINRAYNHIISNGNVNSETISYFTANEDTEFLDYIKNIIKEIEELTRDNNLQNRYSNLPDIILQEMNAEYQESISKIYNGLDEQVNINNAEIAELRKKLSIINEQIKILTQLTTSIEKVQNEKIVNKGLIDSIFALVRKMKLTKKEEELLINSNVDPTAIFNNNIEDIIVNITSIILERQLELEKNRKVEIEIRKNTVKSENSDIVLNNKDAKKSIITTQNLIIPNSTGMEIIDNILKEFVSSNREISEIELEKIQNYINYICEKLSVDVNYYLNTYTDLFGFKKRIVNNRNINSIYENSILLAETKAYCYIFEMVNQLRSYSPKTLNVMALLEKKCKKSFNSLNNKVEEQPIENFVMDNNEKETIPELENYMFLKSQIEKEYLSNEPIAALNRHTMRICDYEKLKNYMNDEIDLSEKSDLEVYNGALEAIINKIIQYLQNKNDIVNLLIFICNKQHSKTEIISPDQYKMIECDMLEELENLEKLMSRNNTDDLDKLNQLMSDEVIRVKELFLQKERELEELELERLDAMEQKALQEQINSYIPEYSYNSNNDMVDLPQHILNFLKVDNSNKDYMLLYFPTQNNEKKMIPAILNDILKLDPGKRENICLKLGSSFSLLQEKGCDIFTEYKMAVEELGSNKTAKCDGLPIMKCYHGKDYRLIHSHFISPSEDARKKIPELKNIKGIEIIYGLAQGVEVKNGTSKNKEYNDVIKRAISIRSEEYIKSIKSIIQSNNLSKQDIDNFYTLLNDNYNMVNSFNQKKRGALNE